MANGNKDAGKYGAQLRRDLSSRRPIPYRRLPGSGRRYYNPYTGQTVTEHYVVRIYRPNLTSIQRELTAQANRRQAVRTRRQRKSLLETFLIKKQAENPGRTLQQLSDQYQAEFQDLYVKLRTQQLAAKAAEIGSEERRNILSPNGEYAQTLVDLGRRLPNQDFLVGMSPASKGGYIDTVVVPYYNELRGY